MRENVTISYRGSSYELGQGLGYYGIWVIGAPAPLEHWPDTAEGWSAASTRFTELEEHGPILPVAPGKAPRPTRGAIAAAAVIGAGVLAGIAGLFAPYYSHGLSVARQNDQLVPHLFYLATWAASAALIVLAGTRQRIGALLALGTSIVTFGLFFTDAGEVMAGDAQAGTGLVLSIIGWLVCAAGSVVSLRLRPAGPADGPARLAVRRHSDSHRTAAIVSAVVAAVGAAATFAPSWDRVTLRVGGRVFRSVTEGNAFANPGPMIAGSVIVMVAIVAVVVLAVLWRPTRLGAALLAGATIPLVAQAISALIQFGSSPAQIGVVTFSGTFVFWVYCAFVLALALSCAQLVLTPDEAAQDASPDSAGTGLARAASPAPQADDITDGAVPSLSKVPADISGEDSGA